MPSKKAAARMRANKLAEAADWRFLENDNVPANKGLLPRVTTTSTALNASADKLEESTKGIFEFLLLNSRGFRLLVRDAHAATKDRLVGKAQLRMPATSRTDAFPPGRSEQLARYRHGRVCWLPFETADFQESEGREC